MDTIMVAPFDNSNTDTIQSLQLTASLNNTFKTPNAKTAQ
jgi:hypothetical protein